MALTASKTASCTIAPQRVWKLGLVGATDTVACMIAFQSVTASAARRRCRTYRRPALQASTSFRFHLAHGHLSYLVCVRRETSPRLAALRLPKALPVVAVRTSDGALPLLQSDEDSGTAVPSPTPQRSVAGLLRRLSGDSSFGVTSILSW